MRTLLRNIPTGLYFRDLENWTSNPDQAFDFRFIERALRLVEKTGFREMELVLCDISQHKTGLPVEKLPFRVEA